MKDYEKIFFLQTFCDKQAVCNKCPLRNINDNNGCTGLIEDWEEEKIDMAYEMILKEEKILKEFLIDRRVVELRNGDRYLVIGNLLMGVSDYFIKDDFTDDLVNHGLHKLDIVRIYEDIHRIGALHDTNLRIVWERKSKKMTKKEIEEALGYEIEIIKEN